MDEYLPVEISLNTLEVINFDIVYKEKMNKEEKERRMNEWMIWWMDEYWISSCGDISEYFRSD